MADEPKHLQDAPRTMRNAFIVIDPNDQKKTIKVVYASFAECLEREANDLRAKIAMSVPASNGADDA